MASRPVLRMSEPQTKRRNVFLKLATALGGWMDVQCRAGAACRPGSRRRLLDSWVTRRRRSYTLVDSENREGCNRVTASLIISLAYNQAMSVRDKMNLGSFCGHVANGRVTEKINKIIMRTSEHRHDQSNCFSFPKLSVGCTYPPKRSRTKIQRIVRQRIYTVSRSMEHASS